VLDKESVRRAPESFCPRAVPGARGSPRVLDECSTGTAADLVLGAADDLGALRADGRLGTIDGRRFVPLPRATFSGRRVEPASGFPMARSIAPTNNLA